MQQTEEVKHFQEVREVDESEHSTAQPGSSAGG